MILIICSLCFEGFTLTERGTRRCTCGQTFGYIGGDRVAHVSPLGTPIGLHNPSIKRGINERPIEGHGLFIEAMVLPHSFTQTVTEEPDDGPNEDVSTERDGERIEPE